MSMLCDLYMSYENILRAKRCPSTEDTPNDVISLDLLDQSSCRIWMLRVRERDVNIFESEAKVTKFA